MLRQPSSLERGGDAGGGGRNSEGNRKTRVLKGRMNKKEVEGTGEHEKRGQAG